MDGGGVVTNGVDFFTRDEVVLEQLACQLHRRKTFRQDPFDLSEGIREVTVPDTEFREILETAQAAYDALGKCNQRALILASDSRE